MKRLILFLIRRRLGLKKWQPFRFSNQKSERNVYMFAEKSLLKIDNDSFMPGRIYPSHVSLNWIISDNCEIVKMKEI